MKRRFLSRCFGMSAIAASFAASPAFAQVTTGAVVPTLTLGAQTVTPTPVPSGESAWYYNDSTFPYFADVQNGGQNQVYWGAGVPHRYEGATLQSLAPSPGTDISDQAGTVSYAAGAPGTGVGSRTYDYNGDWMTGAQYCPCGDGSIVAFVHAENHVFTNGSGEWNSSGLYTSTDNGLHWVNEGEIVGSYEPTLKTNGGLNFTVSPIWQASKSRWLGFADLIPIMSQDPHGMPGTWYALDNGNNSWDVHIQPNISTYAETMELIKGLNSQFNGGDILFDTYLNEYVMVHQVNGDSEHIWIAYSVDAFNWVDDSYVLTEPTGVLASYPQLIGTTDRSGGQTVQLVFDQSPATGGNNKDIISMPLTFTLP